MDIVWILAFTVEINDNKYKDLIEASRKALENVKKIIRKDIEISEIGKVIENTIKSIIIIQYIIYLVIK